MSLYRRGKIWWVRFSTPNGQRIFRSAQTADRRQATEYEATLKAETWRIQKLGERPRRRWEDAVVRWVKEQRGNKASLDNDLYHLRWLDRYWRGSYLDDIGRDQIDRVVQARQAEQVANATVNRMLEVVRAILRRAEREWGWLDRVPAIRLLQTPKRRVRWLTFGEAGRLLAELPEHLRSMAAFTLATGLRERNVTRLEWSQVDLQRRLCWIHPDQAKAKKAIAVPLNGDAVAILRQQEGKNERYVFIYLGKPVTRANNHACRKALGKAGIEDFRWHDLRHTWASWHVQAGTPPHALQELGGWSSYEMVRRYAHLGAEHLAGYAANISGPRLVVGSETNLIQSRKTEN